MGILDKLFKKKDVAKEADTFFKIGAEHANHQKWKEAIDVFQEAIRINPEFAKAHQLLALSYGAIMDRDSALKHYEILKGLDEKLAKELVDTPAFALLMKGEFMHF